MARPFPRVGRSIPRATGGPDEWLLLPPVGRKPRIRLTDLLRRTACRPEARAVLRAGLQWTLRSCPFQNGARSSRFNTLPGPDLGSGSVRSVTDFGSL